MYVVMWHCPHCGAPQAETARCWVCRRSSTTCSTCTHFRRALAGDLGYCGLDARRRPLTGIEQRGCWEPKTAAGEPASPRPSLVEEPHRLRGGRATVQTYRSDHVPALRDFVPVESLKESFETARAELGQPGDTPTATESSGDVPPANGSPRLNDGSAATDAPPAFVIEPDPGWDERTSLFGDREG